MKRLFLPLFAFLASCDFGYTPEPLPPEKPKCYLAVVTDTTVLFDNPHWTDPMPGLLMPGDTVSLPDIDHHGLPANTDYQWLFVRHEADSSRFGYVEDKGTLAYLCP